MVSLQYGFSRERSVWKGWRTAWYSSGRHIPSYLCEEWPTLYLEVKSEEQVRSVEQIRRVSDDIQGIVLLISP